MSRGTSGHVPIINVNTESIKEILNSDGGVISDKARKASEFFVDPAIYNDFVDPEDAGYVTGIDPDAKDAELNATPQSWGKWRNYGGGDLSDVDEFTPMISWKNVIDTGGIDHIPTDSDFLKIYTSTDSDGILDASIGGFYPLITMYPESSETLSNVDSNITNSKYLLGAFQSAMYSNNKLTTTNLATKVGIKYSGDYTGNSPEFDIKVTPRIVDFDGTTSYNKTVYDETIGANIVIPMDAAWDFPWGAVSGAAATAAGTLIKVEGESLWAYYARIVFDWFTGPFQAWILEVWGELASFWDSINVAFKAFDPELYSTMSEAWGVLGPILAGLAAFVGLIIVADMIWDLFEDQTEVPDATYQYINSILGTYNFNDISDSKYTFTFGNEGLLNNPQLEQDIVNGGSSTNYNLDDYNWGDEFGEDNLIDNFPNNSSVRDKYLNMDFDSSYTQYDLSTPPPMIEYFIELVPTANCTLDPDGISAFAVRVMPDKFTAPIFKLSTSIKINDVYRLYLNNTITFKNAKYCDYVYLASTSATKWFGSYHNFTLMRYSQDEFYDSRYPELDGNDLTVTGDDIYNAFSTSGTDEQLYYTYFMQESEANLIQNPYFRIEKDDDAARGYIDMRKFWTYSDTVSISSGAAYITGDGYLYQDITLKNNYHYQLTLDIVVNSGNCYIDRYGTFDGSIFNWPPSGSFSVWDVDDYPGTQGIVYSDDGRFKLMDTGQYNLMLRSDCTSGQIKFDFEDDFDGYIKTCKLQHHPSTSTAKPDKRGATNILTMYDQPKQEYRWMNGYLTVKPLELMFNPINDKTQTITLGLVAGAIQTIDVTWKNSRNRTVEETYTIEDAQTELIISKDYSGESFPCVKTSIELNLYSDLTKTTQLSSLTCNDSNLVSITDIYGAIQDGDLDLSGTLIGSTLIYADFKEETGADNWSFSNIEFRLKSLDISDTDITDSVDSITSITDSFKANNTLVSGGLFNIISIPTLELESTDVDYYMNGQPVYDILDEPSIIWKNSVDDIDLTSLKKLVVDLDYSATENGYLDISGDNLEIVDEIAIAAIDNMVDNKGWEILYNKIVDTLTYEGSFTTSYSVEGSVDTYFISEAYLISESSDIGFNVCSWGSDSLDVWLEASSLGVNSTIVSIELNGTSYSQSDIIFFNDDGDVGWEILNVANPFPALGETCDIKIEYTLVS